MSNGLTFKIFIQITRNFQGRRRNSSKECLQNFMKIDSELTEKSAKNTHRWWKLTATIGLLLADIPRIDRPHVYQYLEYLWLLPLWLSFPPIS